MGKGLLISQYVLLVWCSRALYTWAQLAGGSVCTGYGLISQYVLLVWCSRTLYTWGQLVGEGLLISQ